jgi:putative hydrolase of the HAD superfamily
MRAGGAWESMFRQIIVFDLDDTLYLERDYVASGLRAVAAWMRGRGMGDGLEEAMFALFESGTRGRIFDEALARCGYDAPAALIAAMLTVYRQHRPQIRMQADAEEYLRHPPERTGFAIITDGFLDAQRRKLRALAVHRRGIGLAVCTDRWGRAAWKPHPTAFRHVQAHYGLPAASFTYVADNPAKDFVAPRQLGWRTVRIARPDRLHKAVVSKMEADRVIGSFASL